ncbi:MAG: class I SAM-dependent methyltransferase [Candidatus Nitrosocosmicus sp.]
MNNIWNKVYSKDSTFFGEGPSDFAKKCYEYFIQNNVKRILDLGCGQGRDTIFFSLKGLEIYAVDSSIVAIEGIRKFNEKNNQSINAKCIDAKQGLPFDNNYFDAIYSHMFYNMNFTNKELDFLFQETNRILKTKGLLCFSVRSDKDELFRGGFKIDKDEEIYEIHGFQIRFFSIEQIKSLLLSFHFKVDKIFQSDEDLANLYLVFCYKTNIF